MTKSVGGMNNQRRTLVGIISVMLILALGIFAIIWACRSGDSSFDELKNQQSEMLQLLTDRVGEYDERSIVLNNTTEREAKDLAERFGARLRITSDGRFATLTLPDGVTIADIVSDDGNLSYLDSISADWSARISEAEESYEREPGRFDFDVQDELYQYQTHFDYINRNFSFWEINGSNMTVAVIDTGIDTDHPEFAGRISEWSYNASEDKIVKDYILEDGSYDWSLVEDEQGHGTAVSGTIGAALDGSGTVGIAPSVNILVIKAECDAYGNFLRSSDLVFGIYYAIERDVDVVNMSFGSYLNIFGDATRLGRDSDILMVASAGNYGTAALVYPAADENVIGVGALAKDSWDLADYSSYGENTDITAPGTVYTTKMGGGYCSMNGTSFSSPIVAASLALLKCSGIYRYATNGEIIELLYASAYDLGDAGPDYYFGYGALDIGALVFGERGQVTFDYLSDEIDETEQVFISGNPLQNIPEPERLYAIFEGWYYDIECTEPLELYRDAFDEDLTLYAKWINEDDGIPYTYVILDDGTVEIRSYTGHRKYITVPEIIENRIVSSIGDFAFYGENKLREIQLPESIDHIGLSAFEGCSNLVSINVPDAVVEIQDDTFKDNVRLSAIKISESSGLKTVGSFAFSGCQRLRTIDLPRTLESIDGSAFYGTLSLTRINVAKDNPSFTSPSGILFNKTKTELVAYPAGLTAAYAIPDVTRTIGVYAFAYSSARDIDLNEVESIGGGAFTSASLTEAIIPDSTTVMGNGAFAFCNNLASVTIGSGIQEIPTKTFAATPALKSVTIPENIMTIGAEAFSFSAISEVSFAEDGNLTVISTSAFSMSNIRKLSLPKSLVVIGASAFMRCYSLGEVSFDKGSSLQIIGDDAFAESIALSSISLPETVRSIGDHAFNLSGISGKISISANLEYFGEGAFASCYNLTDFEVDKNNPTYLDRDGVVYTADGKTLVAYPAGNLQGNYTVPSGTETIGAAAFEGAENLVGVNISEGVSKISASAFLLCTNASWYILPTTLTEIQEYAFAKNSSLMDVTIPDKVTQIGKYAFKGDRRLYSINISDNTEMNRIGYAAFADTGVTELRVPANISSIAQHAFEGCSNLHSVTFAKNSKLDSISAYMFDGASNLYSVKFEEGSALTSIQAHGFEGMSNLSEIDFGDASLTNIDNYAFRYCSSLESLTLPDTVENIGRYAFYKCTSLGTLSIPAATQHIGAYAFYGSSNCNLYFTSSYLPTYLDENWDNGLGGYFTGVSQVITDGDWRYATKTNGNIAIIEYLGSSSSIDLTKLKLGGKIDSIGGYAFAGSGISSIILPDSLVEIQRYAFAQTESLKEITIPKNVRYIAANAFLNSAISSLKFAGSNVEVIERYAFASTDNLKAVTLPASLKTMGSYAFYLSGLESLSFAKGFSLSEIPESAFAGTSISSVVIPDSVTRIHSSAFRDNMKLKSVTLGGGEDLRIDSNAFYNTGLESLTITENVKHIGEYAFIGLTGLKNYQVDKDNPNYTSVDGVLYNKDKSKIIAFPAGREGSFEIPAYVESIGFGAFENSSLSSVSFADGINLLTLGWRAFFNATNITEITLPESLISIDYYAFAGCKNLTTVSFAENNKIKGIYEGTFFGCQHLSNITIPDSVLEISDYAFYGCMSIDTIPVSETSFIRGISDYAFAYTGIKSLTLPEGVIDIGKYAFCGALLENVYIPNTNAADLMIGIGAFEDCTAISEITLPFVGEARDLTDRTWLGYIFGAGSYEANKTYVPAGLKSVTILDGATVIPEYAFFELDTIEQLSIPHSIVSVGYGAFYGTVVEYELTNSISVELSDDDWWQNYRFFGSGLCGSVLLDDSMTEIYDYTFMGCTKVESIIIPDSVTSIGQYAFGDCVSLEEVNIPSSVTAIGNGAFSGCSALKEVALPEGIEKIDACLFEECHSLERVNIPESVKSIGSSAFYECYKLQQITIPDGVTDLGTYVFAYCTSLKSIVIPDSVKTLVEPADPYMGSNLFYNCTSLEEVVLPEDTKQISDSMFYGCKSLVNIEIPDGVTSIGGYAFRECESLREIKIPDGVTKIGEQGFYYCYALESIEIPGSVEFIGNMAFRACLSLEKVTLGDGIETIDEHAFLECYNLVEINIPDSVTKLNYGAFQSCESLEKITLSENLTQICSYAFGGCYDLNSITLPASLTQIDINAFYGCTSLLRITNNSDIKLTFGSWDSNGAIAYNAKIIIEADGTVRYPDNNSEENYFQTDDGFQFKIVNDLYYLIGYNGFEETVTLPKTINGSTYQIERLKGVINVIIPEGFKYVDYCAFMECKTLKSVVLPEGITYISISAFVGCENLESINIPNSVISIANNAFSSCTSLKEITIPEGVSTLGYSAFNNCTSLERVTLLGNITEIYGSAFEYCTSLKSINIPEGIIRIAESAFHNCSSLTDVVLPSTLETLEYNAFRGCSALESINIPNSLKYVGDGVFAGTKLKNISISSNHPTIKSINGVLYTADYSKILCVSDGITEITLPSQMTEIPAFAFSNNTTLERIVIPSTVTRIGDEAFAYCTSLREIVIPSSVESIGNSAFMCCDSLETVVIPDSVKTVGENAFSGCKSLCSIVIGNGLTELSRHMVSHCSALTNVVFGENVKVIGSGAFFECSSLEAIVIPETVTEIGSNAFGYCLALKKVELPSSITKIGSSAFSDCQALEYVRIPDSVTDIDSRAFAFSPELKTVEIGKNSRLTRIGWGAFSYTKITGINIPDTVCEIGDEAFANSDIRQLNINDSNPYFTVKDGVLYDKGITTLIYAFDPSPYLTIPSTITHIPVYAFRDLKGIVYLDIPDTVTSIGREAFLGCDNIRVIRLGRNLKSIDYYAFSSCFNLYKIINDSSFDLTFGSDECGNIAEFARSIVDADGNISYNPNYTDVTYIETPDGFLFELCDGKYTLTDYLGREETVTLPTDINGSEYRIEYFNGASHVIIPDGFTVINNSAFCQSYNLKSITIPASVTSIESHAFLWAEKLENIYLEGVVTYIGSDIMTGTPIYNDPDNWVDGCLYLDTCLIAVDKNIKSLVVRPDTTAFNPTLFDDCYLLTDLTIGGNHPTWFLSRLSNLETLTLTSLPEFGLGASFGYSVPITLSKIILKSGCDVRSEYFLSGIEGVTVFVEDEIEACPWDIDYAGWSNGNKVHYGGDWHYVNYYNSNGELITTHYYSASEVIKPPYVYSYKEGEIHFKFEGWDVNGDGIADGIPATINQNYEMKSIITEEKSTYTVKFMDKDGRGVLYTYLLDYGDIITLPKNPTRKGYTFVGWSEIPERVTEDTVIYSEWQHNGNGHSYAQTVVAPTCTEKGYTVYTCSLCDESYKADITDATGHSYGEWTVVEESDCTNDGLKMRRCACGEVQQVIIDSDGHDFVATDRSKSSCSEAGRIEYICSKCGYELTENISLASHRFEKKYVEKSWLIRLIELIINIIFGYEGDWGYYYECTECGHVATMGENISSSTSGVMSSCEHILGDWVIVREASCSDGYKTRSCTICNQTVEASVIPATGEHNYVDSIVPPTCTEQGYTAHSCTLCNSNVYDSYVDALGHDASDEWTVDLEPNCTTLGSKHRTCLRCDVELDITEISPLGHNYKEEIVAPTCEKDGYISHICDRCDDRYYDTTLGALGHYYSDNWIVYEPTCTTWGGKHRACLRCEKEIDYTPLSPLGHSFTNYVSNNDATYENDGTKSAKCDNCDEMHTIVDIGSILSRASMFDTMVDELLGNASSGATLEQLSTALDLYSLLTEEEKECVSESYQILMDAINGFKDNPDVDDPDVDEDDGSNQNGNGGSDGKKPEKNNGIIIVIVVLVSAGVIILAVCLIGGFKKSDEQSKKPQDTPSDKPLETSDENQTATESAKAEDNPPREE